MPHLPASRLLRRVGDGAAPLSPALARVYLDELLLPSGALRQSIELSSPLSSAALGLGSTGLALPGNDTTLGQLGAPPDGQSLQLAGYLGSAPGAPASGAAQAALVSLSLRSSRSSSTGSPTGLLGAAVALVNGSWGGAGGGAAAGAVALATDATALGTAYACTAAGSVYAVTGGALAPSAANAASAAANPTPSAAFSLPLGAPCQGISHFAGAALVSRGAPLSDVCLALPPPLPLPQAPPAAPPQCVANATEGSALALACAPPTVVAAVLSAAYGLWPTCSSAAAAAAQQLNLTAALAAQCVGQPACALLLNSSALGDPAPGRAKQGAASFTCALPRQGAALASSNSSNSSSSNSCARLGLPVLDPRGALVTATASSGAVLEFFVASFGQGVCRQQRASPAPAPAPAPAWALTVYVPGPPGAPDASVLALALPDPGGTLYVTTPTALYAAALQVLSDDNVAPGLAWLAGGAPLARPPLAGASGLALARRGLRGGGAGYTEYRGLAAAPLPTGLAFSPGSLLTLQLNGLGFTGLSSAAGASGGSGGGGGGGGGRSATAAALLVEVHADSGLRLQTIDLSYGPLLRAAVASRSSASSSSSFNVSSSGFSVAAGDTRAGALSRSADGGAVLLAGYAAPPGSLFNASARAAAPPALVLSIAAGPALTVALALALPPREDAGAPAPPALLGAVGQGPTSARGDLLLCNAAGAPLAPSGSAAAAAVELYAGGVDARGGAGAGAGAGAQQPPTALPLGATGSPYSAAGGAGVTGSALPCSALSAAGASAALVSRPHPHADVCLLRPALPAAHACAHCSSGSGSGSACAECALARLQGPPGLVVSAVTSAVWSAAPAVAGGCPSRHGYAPASACALDVRAAVGAACLGRGACDVLLSSSARGDPAGPCRGGPVARAEPGSPGSPPRSFGASALCGLPASLPVCATGAFFYSTTGSLTCAPGLVLGRIAQALVGGGARVRGVCGAWEASGCGAANCTYAPFSAALARCLGRAACIFPANTNALGDPNFGVAKVFAVSAYCVPPPADAACASLGGSGSGLLADPRSAIALPAPGQPAAGLPPARNGSATATVCASGAWGAPVALSCPAGQVVRSVVAVGGAGAGMGGACGAWIPAPCASGPGAGLTHDFSALASSWCTGRAACTIPYSLFVPDFCYTFTKYFGISLFCYTPPPGAFLVLPLAADEAALQHPTCVSGNVLSTGSATISCPPGFAIASIIGVGGATGSSGSCGSYLPRPCPSGPGVGNTWNFTGNLTNCIGGNSCTFGASTAVFGDWCYGIQKIYLVTATCRVLPTAIAYVPTSALTVRPPTFSNPVCSRGAYGNSGVGQAACPPGTIITRISAIAGMGIAGVCGSLSPIPCSIAAATLNLTALAAPLCLGTSSCTFPASVSATNDFCFGYQKQWGATVTCSSPQLPLHAPAALLPVRVCTTGPFQTGTTGTLACPPGTVIASVTATAGGTAPQGGVGCFYTMGSCTLGPGMGTYFDFSSTTTALCKGRGACTFPAGLGSYGGAIPYQDPCFGYNKFFWAAATCVAMPAGVALPPVQIAPPTPPPVLACATGQFQSGTTATIACPSGTLISSITAVAGGGATVLGAGCGNYSVSPCAGGVGAGNIFVFSTQASATCAGKATCTFAAGFGGAYTDYCSGGAKQFFAQATCLPAAQVPRSAAFSLTCASGAFLGATTGTLTCPTGSAIASVVAGAGMGVPLPGACGSFVTPGCSYFGNATLSFGANVTAQCSGLQNCTFPANTNAYPDFCYVRYPPRTLPSHTVASPPPPPPHPSNTHVPPPPSGPPPATPPPPIAGLRQGLLRCSAVRAHCRARLCQRPAGCARSVHCRPVRPARGLHWAHLLHPPLCHWRAERGGGLHQAGRGVLRGRHL